MGSPAPRRWVAAVVAFVVVVSFIGAAWTLGFFETTPPARVVGPPGPPPVVAVLVANNSRLTVPAPGLLTLGPFDLLNNSEWTPTGAWWGSNGTDFCLISQGHYNQWNKTSPPTYKNCDGFGMFGDPPIGGWQSIPGNWGILPNVYDLVWYNLGGEVPIALNITAEINVTAIGQPCDQSPPPVGC